jgi:hypothetical protein
MFLSRQTARSIVLASAISGFAVPALAHHSFGEFEMTVPGHWSGTMTKMNFINPHSYMEIDAVDATGKKLHLRCEMRAATLLKRSGWSKEMFKVGSKVEIEGHPHRRDPNACYIENFKLGDAPMINRNAQFETKTRVDTSKRALRLADGQPNISGDWAVEQLVLTVPPSGGNGSMIPKSQSAAYAAGKITIEQIQATQPPRPKVVYTAEGKKAADSFNRLSPKDNPWFACKPTSFIRDWTADWPINRFEQKTVGGNKVIDITYGLYNFDRRIYVGMAKHPEKLKPSYAGHSIGNWEGNTLVVDTVGFAAGVLSPPTRSSEKMHIVERFTFDPQKFSLRRDYSVTDPVYLEAPYESYDIMYLSDVPFQKQPCKDMTPEFQQK